MPDITSDQAASLVPPGRYLFGEFRLDLTARQLFRADVHVPLTTKAFETLLALVRRSGEIVSKDELIGEVWPDTFVSEDSLTQNISALRRILEDDAVQPKYIATVARRGYRFIAPVSTTVAPRDRERLSTAAREVPAAIDTATRADRVAVPVAGRRLPWRAALLVGAGALAGIVAMAIVPTTRGVAPAASEQLRFAIELPPASTLASGGVVSPDGRHVAFIARDDQSGWTRLWIRTLATAAVRVVPNSDGAFRPFWSADSQSIAFFGGNRLRRAALGGGSPTTICDTIQPRPLGGSWNERDDILFADSGGLYLTSARGGSPKNVLAPSRERQEVSLGWPMFLPGGRSFLYAVESVDAALSGTYGASLDAPAAATRVHESSGPQIAYTRGHLLYVTNGQLNARPFDPAALRFIGEPAVVAGDVPPEASVSASSNAATLALGGAAAEQLTWFDRTGRVIRTLHVPQPLRNFSISPDRRTLLADSIEPNPRSIWLLDLMRDVPTRLTDGIYPVWAPDGKSVVFTAARGSGVYAMYSRALDRPGDDLLLTTPTPAVVNDFSRDGRFIVFVLTSGLPTKQDVWLLPTDSKKPVVLLNSPAREIHAQVSPDGKWIAYASDEENGTFQVFVQAFPGLGGKRRVSSNGGTQPQWRGDGKELFYLGADERLMSVDVATTPRFALGTPRPLFRTQVLGPMTDFRNQYTVSLDGMTFAVGAIAEAGAREPITVIAHWQAETR